MIDEITLLRPKAPKKRSGIRWQVVLAGVGVGSILIGVVAFIGAMAFWVALQNQSNHVVRKDRAYAPSEPDKPAALKSQAQPTPEATPEKVRTQIVNEHFPVPARHYRSFEFTEIGRA